MLLEAPGGLVQGHLEVPSGHQREPAADVGIFFRTYVHAMDFTRFATWRRRPGDGELPRVDHLDDVE